MNVNGTAERLAHSIARPGRTVAIVDLDDLLTGPDADEALEGVSSIYAAMAAASSVDVMLGASQVAHLCAASDLWSSAQMVWRSESDHVRKALVELAADQIVDHYDHVAIFSGRGSFAFMARGLRNDGISISVVARHGSVSGMLQKTANTLYLIEGNKNDR